MRVLVFEAGSGGHSFNYHRLLLPAVAAIVVPTPAEAAITCLTDCSGAGKAGLGCNCPASNTAPPCDNVCFPDETCGGAGFCM